MGGARASGGWGSVCRTPHNSPGPGYGCPEPEAFAADGESIFKLRQERARGSNFLPANTYRSFQGILRLQLRLQALTPPRPRRELPSPPPRGRAPWGFSPGLEASKAGTAGAAGAAGFSGAAPRPAPPHLPAAVFAMSIPARLGFGRTQEAGDPRPRPERPGLFSSCLQHSFSVCDR